MDKWNHWIGILTNIGVILGLALLAIEIDQNSEMLRITSARESTASMAAIMTQYMDPDVANILLKSWEGQPLTILDTTVMEGYLWPLLLTLQDDFIDNREGVYSNERWQSRVRLLDVMLASSAVRTWWGSLKVTFTPEFQTFVDRRLVKLPQTTVKGSEMMMENEPVPTIE